MLTNKIVGLPHGLWNRGGDKSLENCAILLEQNTPSQPDVHF